MSSVATLTATAVAPSPRSLLVWLAALFAVFAAFSPRDLWAPDEPRYGLVARQMAVTGDVLVPRINGLPYPEKPPVAFWAMAATGAVLGGVDAVAARLGCALLAAAAVLTLARLARRWFDDPELGDLAGILFATTGLVLWNSSRAALDLPMTLFSLLALEAGTIFVKRGTATAALAMGMALGLGVLVKGPHALYVPVGGIVGGCLASESGRRLRDPRWLWALAGLAGVVAAWLIPAIRSAGGELTADGTTYGDRLLGQIARRVSGESEPHSHGVLFFVPLILVMGLPWTPAWLAAMPRALRRSRAPVADRFGLGAACGALVLSLVLLSVPGSKRELYLIPPLATACVLAAYALRRQELTFGARATPVLVTFVLAGAALVLAIVPFARHVHLGASLGFADDGPVAEVLAALGTGRMPFVLGGAALLAAAGAWGAFSLRARPADAVIAGGTALGLVWVVLAVSVLPVFDAQKTYAGAALVANRERPRAPLFEAGFTDPSALWWFRRDRIGMLGNEGYAATARVLDPDAPPALVLVKGKFWRERAVHAKPDDVSVLDRAVVLWRDAVGGGEFLLLGNAPAR